MAEPNLRVVALTKRPPLHLKSICDNLDCIPLQCKKIMTQKFESVGTIPGFLSENINHSKGKPF
jgi:hypothetical protein